MGLGWKIWLRTTSRTTSRTTEGERGASLVEYALLLALIAMVCFAAVGLLGNSTSKPISGFGGSLGTGS